MYPLGDLFYFLFAELDVALIIRVLNCAGRWGEAEGHRVDAQEVRLDSSDRLVEDLVDGVDYVIY